MSSRDPACSCAYANDARQFNGINLIAIFDTIHVFHAEVIQSFTCTWQWFQLRRHLILQLHDVQHIF